MSKKDKLECIELLIETDCTVQTKPVINGRVHDDMIAITDCCHNSIEILINSGFILSMNNGKIIVDKF